MSFIFSWHFPKEKASKIYCAFWIGLTEHKNFYRMPVITDLFTGHSTLLLLLFCRLNPVIIRKSPLCLITLRKQCAVLTPAFTAVYASSEVERLRDHSEVKDKNTRRKCRNKIHQEKGHLHTLQRFWIILILFLELMIQLLKHNLRGERDFVNLFFLALFLPSTIKIYF